MAHWDNPPPKKSQFHYRPGQAHRVPGVWGSHISWQLAHESGNVVSPMHQLPSPPRKFQVLISVRGWVNLRSIVRLEGLCQWKIPMTPSGIKPTTFRLVAQSLHQLCHHIPHTETQHLPKQKWKRCVWKNFIHNTIFSKRQKQGDMT